MKDEEVTINRAEVHYDMQRYLIPLRSRILILR